MGFVVDRIIQMKIYHIFCYSFVQVLSSAAKLICWIVLTQLMLCRRCLVRAEIVSHSMMMVMMEMMMVMIFIMAIMVCTVQA